ncbi:MAG: SRPBCC family protein [Chloroflexi bacterium]|nr:SRPBCC family protein [Chloroflexota bacterium]
MPKHERSLETSAPPETIWRIWSDTATWPTWNPDIRAVSLDGPFASGTAGTMTTGAGTHRIRLDQVVSGRSFDLVTSPVPATTFRFHCQVDPAPSGSRISQGVSMSGILAPLFSLLMGNRIAESFRPILAGLAREAEKAAAR